MSKVISAEVSDEMAEQIDAERDGDPPDYDESRSAAVKRLLRTALEDDRTGETVGPPFIVLLIGATFTAAAFADVGSTLGYLGIALIVLGGTETTHGLISRLWP